MPGTEHRSRNVRALRFSTPRSPFSPAAGLTPQSAPRTLSDQDRELATAFRSPVTIPAFTDSITGSKLLTCRFAPRIVCFRRPFGLPLRNQLPVCSRYRLPLRFGPLRFPQSTRPIAYPVSTPLRDCYLPKDQSVRLVSHKPARLPTAPDLHSLPATVSITRPAADHRSRSATLPEACCSSNLLEPFPICSRTRLASTVLSFHAPIFNNFYSLYFEWVTGAKGWIACV
jgi:hypothetical protein